MNVSQLIDLLSSNDPDARLECTAVAFRTRTSGNGKRWATDIVLLLPRADLRSHANH
jgi:hypothetical protein